MSGAALHPGGVPGGSRHPDDGRQPGAGLPAHAHGLRVGGAPAGAGGRGQGGEGRGGGFEAGEDLHGASNEPRKSRFEGSFKDFQ